MTEKELLYIEDALSHEKYYKAQCRECGAKLKDPELKSLVNDLTDRHSQLFNGFFHLI